MPVVIEIVLIVISAVLSALVGRLIYKINKRDERAEERQKEIIEGRIAELNYVDSVGTMAHRTARAVQNQTNGNGELTDAIKYYQDSKHGLEDHLRKQHAREK